MTLKPRERPVQEHPAYSEGFWDAKAGEPLFDSAAPEYEAGWRAFHQCRELLTGAGFAEQPDGQWSKTTVVRP